MTTDQTDPRTDRQAAEPLALRLNDQLGLASELAHLRADIEDYLRHVIDMAKGEHYLDVVRGNAEALLKRMDSVAWFAQPKPLTDEQIARLVLKTVYDGDASTPHRDAWAAEIGIPFARAIERAHGIGA